MSSDDGLRSHIWKQERKVWLCLQEESNRVEIMGSI